MSPNHEKRDNAVLAFGSFLKPLAELTASPHPRDWSRPELKRQLQRARTFQVQCERQPKRHAHLLTSPEYQEAAEKLWQLKQEHHLWLVRTFALRQDQGNLEATARVYLAVRRDRRHDLFYVEHFAGRPQVVAQIVETKFRPHEIELYGRGLPQRWAYIEGQKTRASFWRELMAVRDGLLLEL